MSADAQGHAFQYRRPFTRPQQRHCLFGGRKSGFDVVAVNILVPDTETVREFGEVPDVLRTGWRKFGPTIILADEEKRQFPEPTEIEDRKRVGEGKRRAI